MEYTKGQTVRVWPTHDRVQDGESAFARFMPLEGRAVVWSRWWWQRMRDGDVTAIDPNPAPVADSVPARGTDTKDA